MFSTKLHIALKVLVLSTVFVYFAGPTIVLNYCAMSESAECCCKAHAEQSSRKESTSAIAKEESSCFSTKIVGGVDDTKATVVLQDLPKLVAGDVVVLQTAPVAAHSPLLTLSLLPTDDAAPPQMDICIGGGSLLI